jgi:nitrogen regulatory protein PII
MAVLTAADKQPRNLLGDAIENTEGWCVVGNWRPVKRLEISVPPAAVDALRSTLQDYSLSDLLISEIRATARPGELPQHFYRGTRYDAPIPRIKIEMLVAEDAVSEVMSTLVEELGGIEATVLCQDATAVARILNSQRSRRSSAAKASGTAGSL